MANLKSLVAATLLSVSTLANAEFVDGNLLLSRMLGNETDQVYALAYTIGVADSIMNTMWCPSANMKSLEVLELTKAVLIASPTKRHLSGDVFVLAALKGAYPCANKPSPGSKAV